MKKERRSHVRLDEAHFLDFQFAFTGSFLKMASISSALSNFRASQTDTPTDSSVRLSISGNTLFDTVWVLSLSVTSDQLLSIQVAFASLTGEDDIPHGEFVCAALITVTTKSVTENRIE